MPSKSKAQYAPPASQVDLEERLESGNKSLNELSTSPTYEPAGGDEDEGRDFRVEDNDTEGYLAVSPEYQTYANDTEAPLKTDEGPEAQVFENFVTALENEPPEQPVEPDDDEEEEVDKPDASPSTGGAAGSTTS